MPQPPHKILADRLRDIGNECLAKDRVEEAITNFRRAVILAPEYAYLYGSLSDAYIKNRQYDDALLVCTEARQSCREDLKRLNIDPDEFFDRWLRDSKEQIRTRQALDQYRIYIMETVSREPGFLQAQLKSGFADCDPNLMGLAVWELVKECKLLKVKKGRSFQLYLNPA